MFVVGEVVRFPAADEAADFEEKRLALMSNFWFSVAPPDDIEFLSFV